MRRIPSIVCVAAGEHQELCGQQNRQARTLIAHHHRKRHVAAFNMCSRSKRCPLMTLATPTNPNNYYFVCPSDNGRESRSHVLAGKGRTQQKRKSKSTIMIMTESTSMNNNNHVMFMDSARMTARAKRSAYAANNGSSLEHVII